jgi:hypothetical protein
LQTKKSGALPDPPNFVKILECIGLSTYILPTLPLALYQLVTPWPLQKVSPGTVLLDDHSVAVSNASTVSTITGATTPSIITGVNTNRSCNTAVQNTAVDSTLQALLPANVKIKNFIGADEVPQNGTGSPFCLAYHL